MNFIDIKDINYYKDISIYNSNAVEFWVPITNRVAKNIIPNRYLISSFGNTWDCKLNKPIGFSINGKGYIQVPLATLDHNRLTRKIHRIVMISFSYFDGCENYEVNHKDGVKYHNYISNLEWCTSSENTIHAINMGLKTVFGNKTNVQLTNGDITNILQLYNSGIIFAKDIKQILNLDNSISNVLIENICHKRCRLSYFSVPSQTRQS